MKLTIEFFFFNHPKIFSFFPPSKIVLDWEIQEKPSKLFPKRAFEMKWLLNGFEKALKVALPSQNAFAQRFSSGMTVSDFVGFST